MHTVLFVEAGSSAGGSFESLYQYLCVMDRQKFRPVVVYLNQNPYIPLLQAKNIPVYLLHDRLYSQFHTHYLDKTFRLLARVVNKYFPAGRICLGKYVVHRKLIRALKKIITQEKVDILHLNNNIRRDFFGAMISQETGVICVSHLRSMRDHNFLKQEAEYCNRYIDTYIANSQATQNYWQKQGLSSSKLEVIYNAISLQKVTPIALRETWAIPKQTKYIIGCVTNLVSFKGHEFLLESFAHFLTKQPHCILLLVGEGSLRETLQKKCQELAIQQAVIFTGYQPNARRIIASLDLLVIPSQSESFGRVAIEAMLEKTPVVACQTGGLSEIIEHGYNGLLVEYGNSEELSQMMQTMLEDHVQRESCVMNGYAVVREKFDITNYARELEKLYCRLLA